MNSLATLYKTHLATLQQRAQQILQRTQFDALLIHSGELLTVCFDDHHYPFKVNPHFKAWLPLTDLPHCWLWIDGVNKPKLWFYSPVDYWHQTTPLPQSYWTEEIEIIMLRDHHLIAQQLPLSANKAAYIGPSIQRAEQLGIQPDAINPQRVINYLHYHRSYKTDYELSCMREAQKRAVAGHQAAKEAFLSGMSEFDINLAYLTATGHRDHDVPYSNIIALNEHAAILHYTNLDAQPPEQRKSFLIDAGADYNGYAADVTRSYAANGDTLYGQLIRELNSEQLAVIDTLKSGARFSDYHHDMHYRIAKILLNNHLVKDISPEAMVAENLTGPFLPHGLGHLLGLQVHDVAGFMQNDHGEHLAAPSRYPHLRCTRIIEPRMVLTIEPGLYFIESLLSPWREGSYRHHFDWDRIHSLQPFGGIRIEDNIIIHEHHTENMTRDLRLA